MTGSRLPAMTSEARSRPLHARLAPSGAPREPASTSGSTGGHGATRRAAATASSMTAAASNGRASGSSHGEGDAEGRARRAPRPSAAAGGSANAGSTARTQRSAPIAASLIHDDPLAALLDEAQAAVAEGANSLRDVRERYRAAYLERVEQWEGLRAIAGARPDASTHSRARRTQAATDEAVVGREVGVERSTLGRIDLAVRSLENAWLFLAREDSSLISDPSGPPSAADAQMRIVEAQEAERSRLAREVHDGPAQALANAIFQVEVVQRLLDRDERLARAELRQLREVLTRELRGVRAYLSQLRPPLLADLGLSGAIHEAADQIGTALDVPVHVELDEGIDSLPETVEVVTLRVIQEALQNVRKHAQPSTVRIRMSRDAAAGWSV